MKSLSPRRILFAFWLLLFPFLAFLLCWPINSQGMRLGILLVAAALILGSLAFSWRKKPLFVTLLAIALLIGIFLILPGRSADRAALHAAYLTSLHSYEGVTYVWGGETRWGIDCSGLIRKSLECALARRGLLTLNPALIRGALDLWWNDTTAREMGRGYDGRTVPITTCPSLQALDPTRIAPGDMAVTDSGTHVMAYLGGSQWIGADPLEGKVTIFTIPDTKSGWFLCPMKILRWHEFPQ